MASISNNDIANAIYLAGKDKDEKETPLFISNVIKFLAKKRLISKSKDILQKLENISNTENGILKIKITTPVKLEANFRKEIENILIEKYKVKKILFTEIIDEKLIGGFKVETTDEVIDLTIFNKLKKLQEYLTR
jgi:ATP synthase F1 delta subunit